MGDLKRGYREAEDKAREAWRKADGDEDLGDKLGNLGDGPGENLERRRRDQAMVGERAAPAS